MYVHILRFQFDREQLRLEHGNTVLHRDVEEALERQREEQEQALGKQREELQQHSEWNGKELLLILIRK